MKSKKDVMRFLNSKGVEKRDHEAVKMILIGAGMIGRRDELNIKHNSWITLKGFIWWLNEESDGNMFIDDLDKFCHLAERLEKQGNSEYNKFIKRIIEEAQALLCN